MDKRETEISITITVSVLHLASGISLLRPRSPPEKSNKVCPSSSRYKLGIVRRFGGLEVFGYEICETLMALFVTSRGLCADI